MSVCKMQDKWVMKPSPGSVAASHPSSASDSQRQPPCTPQRVAYHQPPRA